MIEAVLILVVLALMLRLNKQLGLQALRITALEAQLGTTLAKGQATADAVDLAPGPVPDAAAPSDERPADTWGTPSSAAEAPIPPRAAVPSVPPVAAPGAEPQRPGFEEALGTRWAVWAGGVTLALGGIFLVRYSIEQDLIGPGLRVAFGGLFALALVAAGEWLRRNEAPLAAFRSANLPAILTAAGTSTAFATTFAAYALYDLVGPLVAFGLLGLISLVTMAAAILHGPALGGLGLVAALASPLLVDTNDPSPLGLVLYLCFAVGAAYGVARLRLWRWLAVAAATGALLWGFAFLLQDADWARAGLAHVAAQLALALLFLVADPHRHTADADAVNDRLATPVLFGFAVLAVAHLAFSIEADLIRPSFAGLVVAFLIAGAYRFPPAASGAAAAALVALGTLASWPVAGEAARESMTVVPDLASAPRPEAIGAFLTAAILLNALVALPSLWRLVVGPGLRLTVAAWYAGAATVGPLLCLIVAYWRVTAFDTSVPFALAAAALATAFAGLAGWLGRRRFADSPAVRLAVGATASASVAALAAGLTFAFDRGVLTVSLALAALGTAYVADRTAIPALRWGVGALGLAVAARFAWDPTIMRGAVGSTPIVNWLLWGYGVPALAFGLSARILARAGENWTVRLAQGLTILFSALLVFLEIRHALNGGDPFRPTTDHLEAGLVVSEALAFSLVLMRLDLSKANRLFRWASLGFGALALAGSALSLGVASNPYFFGGRVLGGPIVNSLLPAYLIPAALAAALAWAARGRRPTWFVLSAAGLALLLEIAWGLLTVRHLFRGPDISFFRETSEAELWCYTLVLIANGLVLLAAGFASGSRTARLASLGCIVVAVLKVFLIDLSALEGLTRALSFVGLGLALVGIGFVYQRLLARQPGRALPPAGSAPNPAE